MLNILGDSGGCGVTDEVIDWMESVQNSATPENMYSSFSSHPVWQLETPGHKYSWAANSPSRNYWNRTKRATRPKDETNNKNTCSLFIQTDPLIWRHIFEQVCFEFFL